MGLALLPSHSTCALSLRSRSASRSRHAVRVNSAEGAPLTSGRVGLVSARLQQSPGRSGAPVAPGSGAASSNAEFPIAGRARESLNGVATAAVATAATMPSTQQGGAARVSTLPRPQMDTRSPPPRRPAPSQPQPIFVPMPEDVIQEFEHKLEADIQTVGVTLTAILGVIIFWRGVWSLLDHFIGDSVFGDICCVIVGLVIVLYIRLSGLRLASFWPPS